MRVAASPPGRGMQRPATELPTRKFSASGAIPELQLATTQFRSEASEANGTTTVFEPPGVFGAIGDYNLVRRLGGQVFLAHHRATRQPFALRVLEPAPAVAHRQLAEARALATIDHPNVGRVIEVGTDADRVYLVMEYLRGTTLASVLELHGALSSAQAIRIGALVAKGLHAAHRRGVVHRNLEVGAVIVLPSERGRSTLKLVDFAISDSPEVVRIPRHSMSPELCSGEPVDHRTDLYSLGVLLHRVCTGRDPFDGSPLEILAMHRFRSVVRPVPALDGVPGELAAVIRRCLCEDPAGRYPSAAEVIEALRLAANEPVRPGRPERPEPAERAALFVDVDPAAAEPRVTGAEGIAAVAAAAAAAVPASAPNRVVVDEGSGILIVPGGAPARIATAVPIEAGRAWPRRRPWMALLVLVAAMTGGAVLALSTMDRREDAREAEPAASATPAVRAMPAPAVAVPTMAAPSPAAPEPAAAPPAASCAPPRELVPDAVSAPDAIPAGAVRAATRAAAAAAPDEPPRKRPHREHRSKSRRARAANPDDDDDAFVIISDDQPRIRHGRSHRADP